jgi:hypothetical protein
MLSLGCESRVPDALQTVRRDSAGIEIVESGAPAWDAGEGWTLSAEPVLRIGVADGDSLYQFHQVRSAVFLDDDRVAVANSGTSTIRFYDSDGSFQQQSGGPGNGPGEFATLGPLTRLAGDSVAAYDFQLRRLTILSPVGTIARTVGFDVLQTPVPIGRPFRLNDGSYIAGGVGFSSQQLGPDFAPGLFRSDAPVFRIAPDARTVDTLGMFPGMEIAMRRTERGASFGPPPFGRNLHYFVSNDRIFIGTAVHFEVMVYATDGTLKRIVRGPPADLAITPDRIAAHRDAMIELAEARGFDRAAIEADYEDLILPPARAAYDQMLVDDEGNLWLGTSDAGFLSAPRRWTIFAADGSLLGGLIVPERFRILDVRGGKVLGVATDDLDIEYVHIHALERREAA